jgi:nuclear pore complex protein Nup107
MHLTAARALATRLPSSIIARSKTRAIIGQSVDFDGLEETGEDEDLTEVLDGSADEKRMLKKYLLAEAKNFIELETLIMVLDQMETITSFGQLMEE